MSGHGHITVDTSQMADALDLVRNGVSRTADAVGSTAEAANQSVAEIGETTKAVGKTNLAVNAMMTSVVAAETEAAQRVSRNVTTGFLGLISSQLMQKKIEAQTVMQSKCQLLIFYNNQLNRLKAQLEGDFQRITARYAKIIKQLNDNLKSRVYKLDAPAAEVSDEGYHTLDKRVLVSAVPMPLIEQDVLSLSTQVCISHCKESCAKVLPEMQNYVLQLRNLQQIMDSSVRSVKCDAVERISMPIIIMEAESPYISGTQKMDIVLGDKEEQKAQTNHIRAVFDEIKGSLKWRSPGSSRDVVIEKVYDLAKNHGVSERMLKIIQQLVEASFWEEMEDK